MFAIALLVVLQGPPSGELALAKGVDPARAQQRVRELVALGPRMGGTRSGDAAADYIAKAMRELGLETKIVDDPEKSAYQPLKWSLRAWREDAPDDVHVLTHAWPWQYSPDANGTAELALESREGAAWLTDKVARGESQGAVVLADGSNNSDGEWPIPRSLKEGAKQPCFGISKKEGAMLREWLAGGATVKIRFEIDGEARKASPKTVIARLPGAKGGRAWQSDYLMFCAHGDSIPRGPAPTTTPAAWRP